LRTFGSCTGRNRERFLFGADDDEHDP
jgi:hypothetical protein